MSTRFVSIMGAWQARLQSITHTPPGGSSSLGSSVYVNGLQPIPMDNTGKPLTGSLLIDPGEASMSAEAGEVRASTATLEAVFVRDVDVLVVWPIADKSQWLTVSEDIAAAIRGALFADQSDWRMHGVQRLRQTAQESSFPEIGAQALMVSLTFELRYVES